MWIFGYGSLIWKVDFPYKRREIGYIKGYVRRFWQASIDHRGVPGKPGRVVTLIPAENPEDQVWGVAYELTEEDGIHESKARLQEREKRYETVTDLTFFPISASNIDGLVFVTCYIAPLTGSLFLGPAPIEEIAQQISNSSGPSGSNIEYFQKLRHFMCNEANVRDPHVEEIEKALSAVDKVWGVAYQIADEDCDHVQRYLDHREKDGYTRTLVQFHPAKNNNESLEPFNLEFYLATHDNPFYVGPDSLSRMSWQILTSRGPSGSNTEYLYQLAEAIRGLGDEVEDQHLFELEQTVRELERDHVYEDKFQKCPTDGCICFLMLSN